MNPWEYAEQLNDYYLQVTLYLGMYHLCVLNVLVHKINIKHVYTHKVLYRLDLY